MVVASPLRYDLEPVKRQQCVQLLREIHPHVQRSRLDSDAGLFSRRHGVQDLRIRLIVGAPQNAHGSLSTRAIELGNHLRFIWNLQQYLEIGDEHVDYEAPLRCQVAFTHSRYDRNLLWECRRHGLLDGIAISENLPDVEKNRMLAETQDMFRRCAANFACATHSITSECRHL